MRVATKRKKWLKEKQSNFFDLSGKKFKTEDFEGCRLNYTDFSDSNLENCNLSHRNLYACIFKNANLKNVDFTDCDLREVNFHGANLSGVKGLVNPINYMAENFEKTANGYLVYKSFHSSYNPPDYWNIAEGSIIEEIVDYNRTINCGCGINVATKEWALEYGIGDIWELLIKWEWLPDIVVPYNSKGRIRCGRAMILKKVKEAKRFEI